ncbi:MAG: 30S ribosomal protein S6 [Chloroflexi bacterium]|nr:30S ribosomal protein S6 [Chloroflexota bacterium]
MRDYELVFIAKPSLSDEEVEALTQRVSQLIANNGGEVAEVKPWGRKRLAYAIGDAREGHYVEVRFKMSPAATAELERGLKLTEDIIRYLFTKVGE